MCSLCCVVNAASNGCNTFAPSPVSLSGAPCVPPLALLPRNPWPFHPPDIILVTHQLPCTISGTNPHPHLLGILAFGRYTDALSCSTTCTLATVGFSFPGSFKLGCSSFNQGSEVLFAPWLAFHMTLPSREHPIALLICLAGKWRQIHLPLWTLPQLTAECSVLPSRRRCFRSRL